MVDNLALEQLLQMVETHQPTHWHLVVPVVMEMLVEIQQANMFLAAAVVRAAPVAEQLVELVLIQISQAQLLCMAVVEPAQVQTQDLFPQVVEVMTIRHQQTEVEEDHNQQEVVV
jgi:hypothetical protein